MHVDAFGPQNASDSAGRRSARSIKKCWLAGTAVTLTR